MFVRHKYLAIALAVLPATVARAQTTSAGIYGSVRDQSGGIVARAAVTATNNRTGVSQTAASNDSGIYVFPALQPGNYRLSVEIAGFRRAIVDPVPLQVSARINLDFTLEIGAVTESVTVEAGANPLEAATASVSNVVDAARVQALPLQNRDAGALIALQAGVLGDNFNGTRTQSQNVSLDGVNIQEPRYNGGYALPNLTTTNSVDRISEFRVSTASADAEFGRGLGQVQMIGKSGTNELHGTAFGFNRVTALSANDWFNNMLGRNADGSLVAPRNFLIRNQFGASAGAPVRRNKTFAFFLYEGQRQKSKATVNTTVLTDTARQGAFRFFPGVRNAAASAAVPTVDTSGNPVMPPGATGPMQSVSIFGKDPNRMTADTTGNIAKALADYPSPNNFLRGDGLNTAGFYWQRPGTQDRNVYHARLDHSMTESTRLAFSVQIERAGNLNNLIGQQYPAQPPDFGRTRSNVYSLSATTTLRPNLIQEFRAGVNRFSLYHQTPFSPGFNDVLPRKGSQPFYITFLSPTNAYTSNNSPQGRISPIYQFSDKVTWLKGCHVVKAGLEAYFASSNGYNSFRVVPEAVIGAGSVPVQNIAAIPGIGANATAAQNLLLDLSGALATWTQAFNSAGGRNPVYTPGEPVQRTWRQRMYSGFIQDDWKIARSVTVNLGLRYDYYGVPFEANGKAVIPVNGSAGIFGISGTTYADANRPGNLAGSLTQLMMVGPGSANPDLGIHNKDFDNFGPALGISWRINDRTAIRAGYSIVYDRNSLRNYDAEVGSNPGINSTPSFTSASAWNLANIPVPFQPPGQPLATVPLTDRSQTLRVYDSGLRTPYVQTWNFSVQREIARDSVLTARYIGTKGTKLLTGVDVSQGEIFSNGLLDAFNITRAGGNAPLFDRMFAGLAVQGRGTVDGVNVRGSEYARANSTLAVLLADGRVGTFGNNLNNSNLQGNERGGIFRYAGLPENFFYTNPQFLIAFLVGNNANSTYHSMQLEYEKRFGRGLAYQGNYTWGKAMGENEGATQVYDNAYRNVSNRRFDKRVLNFNRTHVFKSNGIWELPYGWTISGILTLTTGRPLTVMSPYQTYGKYNIGNTPDVIGTLSKDTGALSFDGVGACYFCGFRQIAEPNKRLLTPELAAISTQFAREGHGAVLQNPLPGTLGTLAQNFFTGPAFFNADLSLAKNIRIFERYTLNLRTDWLNATNHQDFANATIDLNLNSPPLGRLTGRSADSNNNRIIVLGARLNW